MTATPTWPPLLPCPFCGDRLRKKADCHGDFWAHGNVFEGWAECPASDIHVASPEDAAEWNRRPAPSPDMANAVAGVLVAALDLLQKLPFSAEAHLQAKAAIETARREMGQGAQS
jgi:hypothetical protein